jgi:hypothetical protein
MTDLLPVPALDSLPEMPWKEKLAYLTFKFLQAPQIECPLEHEFKDGQYIRNIAIPQGTLFIGRPHKLGHIVELLSGSVLHVTQQCRRIVAAPFLMTTAPEYQVCALALTDITARTVHPDTGERDIEALETALFGSIQSMKELGEAVDTRLRKRLYERDSSSGSGSGSGGGHRYSGCWI